MLVKQALKILFSNQIHYTISKIQKKSFLLLLKIKSEYHRGVDRFSNGFNGGGGGGGGGGGMRV